MASALLLVLLALLAIASCYGYTLALLYEPLCPRFSLTAFPTYCRIPVASCYSFGVDVFVLIPAVIWWRRRHTRRTARSTDR